MQTHARMRKEGRELRWFVVDVLHVGGWIGRCLEGRKSCSRGDRGGTVGFRCFLCESRRRGGRRVSARCFCDGMIISWQFSSGSLLKETTPQLATAESCPPLNLQKVLTHATVDRDWLLPPSMTRRWLSGTFGPDHLSFYFGFLNYVTLNQCCRKG